MSTTAKRPFDRFRAFASRPLGAFVVAFLLGFIPMTLWNLASPISSSPDEPTHFIRAAAVARGEIFTGPLPSQPRESEVEVPRYVAWTPARTCFAFKPDTTANCVPVAPRDLGRIVVSGHTAGANSPGWYALTGVPSLFLTGDKGLYAMRMVNSLLCAAMIGVIFMGLTLLRKPRWALIAAYAAITPMTLYLGGTMNPNGVEALSAGALFVSLTVLLSRMVTGRRLAAVLAGVGASTFLLVGTRNIALLWIVLALGGALLLSRRAVLLRRLRQPSVWVTVGIAVVLCGAALAYFLRPSVVAPAQKFAGAGSTFWDGFTYMLQHTFEFGSGWIGFFGWVDTPAPGFALVSWGAVLLALVVAALVISHRRARLLIILLAVAFVLVPAISQAAVIGTAGFIWQGRYTLALVIMLALASGIVADRYTAGRTSAVFTTIGVFAIWLLAFSHTYTFFVALKRYVVGETAYISAMFNQPAWQPPLKWEGLVLLFTIFAVVMALVMTSVFRRVSAAPLPAAREETPIPVA
ncbi:DUF2142 domain-containing protein [Leifsonia sp. EB34]|uniref:DUF2142 domain-containing protein n=1 Tax=Leifsonia sp. EB34 TaxID=3156303 RepID=UPI0035172B89